MSKNYMEFSINHRETFTIQIVSFHNKNSLFPPVQKNPLDKNEKQYIECWTQKKYKKLL